MKTPEEIARQIVDDQTWDNTEGLHGTPIDYDALASLIAVAIRDERARCMQAVIDAANDLPPSATFGFYNGYKQAMRAAIAALRSLT